MNDKKRNKKGDKRNQYRFTHELPDDGLANSAHHFSYAYFFTATHGTRCGQIHEIDTSDQKNKTSYATEGDYVSDATAILLPICEVVVKSPIRQWKKKQFNIGITAWPYPGFGNHLRN